MYAATPAIKRVMAQVEYVESGCWIYTGAVSSNGYGKTSFRYTQLLAHRVAYEHYVGTIPAGMHLDHLCRVRHCVNPGHLEPVPCRTNLLRGIGPSAVNAAKTHCLRGHPFNIQNTYICPAGKRRCRACRAAEKRSAA